MTYQTREELLATHREQLKIDESVVKHEKDAEVNVEKDDGEAEACSIVEAPVLIENQKYLEDKTMCSEVDSNLLVPCLVINTISIIFARAHAHEVQNMSYYCEELYKLISSSCFTTTHLRQSKPESIAVPYNMIVSVPVGTQYIHPDIIQRKIDETVLKEEKDSVVNTDKDDGKVEASSIIEQPVLMESRKNLEDVTMCSEMDSNLLVSCLVINTISTIFPRVHAHEIQKLNYCCKELYKLISSSCFTTSHLHHSKPDLIAIPFVMTMLTAVGTRCVHSDILQIKDNEMDVPLVKDEKDDEADADKDYEEAKANSKTVFMEEQENLEDKTICSEKESNLPVPYLGIDTISIIFTKVHARDVQKLRHFCKEWYKLISSSFFTAAHLRQAKPGLIAIPFSMSIPIPLGTQYRQPDIIQIKDNNEVSICSLELKCEKSVESVCNGLVLLEDLESKFWVVNPVTGQILILPPCIQRSSCLDIKREIIFIDSTGEYKVVSVVLNTKTGLLGYEILVLGFSTWKSVSSPFECISNAKAKAFLDTGNFVSIDGVLHIALTELLDMEIEFYYVVSFDTVKEKFYKSERPYWCRNGHLLELDGCPSFVLPNSFSCDWEIWALKDLDSGNWNKQYSVCLTALSNEFPRHWYLSRVRAALENGRFLIVQRRFEYYVYDVLLQQLRCLELDPEAKYSFRSYVESVVDPCLKPRD